MTHQLEMKAMELTNVIQTKDWYVENAPEDLYRMPWVYQRMNEIEELFKENGYKIRYLYDSNSFHIIGISFEKGAEEIFKIEMEEWL